MRCRIFKGFTLLLKEIGNFYRFFGRTPQVEKAIVFYAEHEGYYSYFEGIIEKLISKHNRTLCYVTSDPDDPILQKSNASIRAFYLNKLLPLFMVIVNCKVFVMTLPDLNQFHLRRSLFPVHYIYVFHSLVSTHMAYRQGAFDHYDSILCCGSHQIGEIRRYEELNKLPPKRLQEAGYYRLERIYNAYQEYKPPLVTKGTILIAPSWGVANILESCGKQLIALLLGAGYTVIARPHPETMRRSHNMLTLLASKFNRNPHFTLEMSVATDDSLLQADVLICDYSGVALEYAFGTERPVLFLDVPLKVQNQGFRGLGIEPLELTLRTEIGVVVPPERLDTIPQIISELVANRVVYQKRIAKLRKQYVYAFGQSSDIGARYMVGIVGESVIGSEE